MQWLIDLIIDAIGIPPVYVSRGDYAIYDFFAATLIADGDWHELDLSGIVAEGAQAVKIHTKMTSDTVAGTLRFRPGGYVNSLYHCTLRTQVANVTVGAFITVGLSSDRKIEYQFFDATFGARNVTVQGWWF